MKSLLKIIRGRKALAIAALFLCGLSAAVTLWWNSQLGGIIDMVSAGRSLPTGAILSALTIMLVMGAAGYANGYLTGFTCEYMTHDLRMGYARHFASLPFEDVEKLNSGEQLSKLQNEISGVSDYLSSNLFKLAGDAVRFLATFTWLMFINPALTLASNLPAFLIVFYVIKSSKTIGAASQRSQAAKGNMNKYADTLLTLFPIIRLYDAARLAADGFTGAVLEWEKHTARSERTSAGLMSLSGILSAIPLLVLFFAGGRMVINGEISVGTLYIFLNLSGNVSGVLMDMPRHIASFRRFSADMKRLEGKICL